MVDAETPAWRPPISIWHSLS